MEHENNAKISQILTWAVQNGCRKDKIENINDLAKNAGTRNLAVVEIVNLLENGELDLIEDRAKPALDFLCPSLGVAFPVAPGGVLIFNPLYPHCGVKKRPEYENHSVYVMSVYISSKIVGLNDNKNPFVSSPEAATEE